VRVRSAAALGDSPPRHVDVTTRTKSAKTTQSPPVHSNPTQKLAPRPRRVHSQGCAASLRRGNGHEPSNVSCRFSVLSHQANGPFLFVPAKQRKSAKRRQNPPAGAKRVKVAKLGGQHLKKLAMLDWRGQKRGFARYPFSPVVAMPRMNVRCASRNSTSTGRTVSVDAAMSWFQGVSPDLLWSERKPSARVNWSWWMR
jgi:hypothetical protein